MSEGYNHRLEEYRQAVRKTFDEHTFIQRALEGSVQVHISMIRAF
jgi:hypothetical protein